MFSKSDDVMRHSVLHFLFILISYQHLLCQAPPTIPKFPHPPDLSEKYKANPYFYEIMSAFPNSNSYYTYKFEEVKRDARSDPEAMVILGDHYRLGRSTPQDYKQALKEYHRAAGKGYAKAYHRIAYMYADGLGLPKDREKIMEYLKKSADGGYDLAQYDLALIYLNGKFNEPRSVEKAFPFLVKASAQGHKLATELLAMLAFHANAPGTAIPTGLEEALKQFRKVGDSDGERALMQNISTFGGLRYYLRIIPGFLPGVDATLNPTDPEEGLRLLEQLKAQENLTGASIYEKYRAEITENILYHSYFNAQGNRRSLLDFIIFTHHHDAILKPGNYRYFEAAARDFRLTVNFSNEAALADLLAEFATYPATFAPEDLAFVADRVYVSLYLKDSPENLRKHIRDWLIKEEWPLTNLSSQYACHFELSEFELHKSDLPMRTARSMTYIAYFADRLEKYQQSAALSVGLQILPVLRSRCIHPEISLLLHKMLSTGRFSRPNTLPVEKGLERASKDILTDINLYYNTLRKSPADYGLDTVTEEIALSIEKSFKSILDEGAVLINQYCKEVDFDPWHVLQQINRTRSAKSWILQISPNNVRTAELLFICRMKLLVINQITFSDPNGVMVAPESVNLQIAPSPCPNQQKLNCQLLKVSNTPLTRINFTITNLSPEEIKGRIIIMPIIQWDGKTTFDPWETAASPANITREWILIPAGQTVGFETSLTEDLIPEYILPAFEPESESITIPYFK
jgi:TPR repeat protein